MAPKPKTTRTHDKAARVYCRDRAAWRAWLAKHHTQSKSIWLVYDKKTRDAARALSYADIVEEALCFGWIDSLPRRLSETQSMLYLSPRRARSAWSALNKSRIAALIERGLMTEPGLAKIAAAKADGSWSLLDAIESLTMPDDLAAAFRRNPPARKKF